MKEHALTKGLGLCRVALEGGWHLEVVDCHPGQENFGGSKSFWDLERPGDEHRGRLPLLRGTGQGPSHDLKTLFIYGGGEHRGGMEAHGPSRLSRGAASPISAGCCLGLDFTGKALFSPGPETRGGEFPAGATMDDSEAVGSPSLSPCEPASEADRGFTAAQGHAESWLLPDTPARCPWRWVRPRAGPCLGSVRPGGLLYPKNFRMKEGSPVAAPWFGV